MAAIANDELDKSLLSDELEHISESLKLFLTKQTQSLTHLTESLTNLTQRLTPSLADICKTMMDSGQRLQEALRGTEERLQEALRGMEERFKALQKSDQRSMARGAIGTSMEGGLEDLSSSTEQKNSFGREKYEELEGRMRKLEESVKTPLDRERLLQNLENRSPPASTTRGSVSALPPATSPSHEPSPSNSYQSPPTRSATSTSPESVPSTSAASEFSGGKALLEATDNGKLEVVRTLLDIGVSVNFSDSVGSTPLHLAASIPHADVISLLLERGADVNSVDSGGYTALHFCAAEDTTGHCVEMLVAAGADVNIQSYEGDAPLHWAASQERRESARVLIAAGATKSIKNEEGLMPYELASSSLSEILRPSRTSVKLKCSKVEY